MLTPSAREINSAINRGELTDVLLRVLLLAFKENVITEEVATTTNTCPRCRMDAGPDTEFCPHCGARVGEHRKVPWWHLHRRLYDWTLAWAYRPSSSAALFGLSFFESIIFPVPPDVLLIPLVLGNQKRWMRTALNCTIASVLGAMAAYLIGWLAWSHIDSYMYAWFGWAGLTRENFQLATPYIERGNFLIVFTAGFTPLPFKVFNIVAGSFFASPNIVNRGLYFVLFLLAALTSRAARFFLLAGLMRISGPKITPFIDKYFNLLAILFAVLLVGGFVVIKYIL